MRPGLSQEQNFNEQIRLFCRVNDVDSTLQATKRIAELTKKDFLMVDTFIEGEEQCFVLEKSGLS